MLKLHTGILFFGKSLQHASEINETLVFWMPPEGPRTPVAFHFLFAVLFSIKIPLRVCLFSNTIAPKSRLLNCYTTVVLLLRLRCYENILFSFFFPNFDSHIFSLANIYFFCLISAQDLPLFVKNGGAAVLFWEMKRRLGMSEVFQMPRATNWPNRETLWQLCERADAEEKKWLGHDCEDAPWCF